MRNSKFGMDPAPEAERLPLRLKCRCSDPHDLATPHLKLQRQVTGLLGMRGHLQPEKLPEQAARNQPKSASRTHCRKVENLLTTTTS